MINPGKFLSSLMICKRFDRGGKLCINWMMVVEVLEGLDLGGHF